MSQLEGIEKVLVNGSKCLKGLSIKLEPFEIFGLKVGDQVSSIGETRKSPTPGSRQDKFKTFLTYIGIYSYEDNKKALGFLVPKDEVIGTFKDVVVLYDLIESNGCYELIRPNYSNNGIMIYQPIFNKLNSVNK